MSCKQIPNVAWLAGLLFTCFGPVASAADAAQPSPQGWLRDVALTVYGGRLTEGEWEESFGIGTQFIQSDLIVAALGKTLSRSPDGGRSYELEAQIGKHSGLQDNWETNLLAGVRWHRLPWSDRLNSTAAIGLGLSYASALPRAEVTLNGGSEKLLAYWHLELTLGPPRSDWQASLRLHHRSPAYGLFGDRGGSNAVALGVRYAFD